MVVISVIPRMLKEIPDDLFEELQYNSDKWYEIGLSLQVHRNLLDDLKHSWKSDIAKLNEVIRIWKNTKPSPITWETVMTAVQSPLIGNKEIADRICQKLMRGKLLLLLSNDFLKLILSLSINYIVQTFDLQMLSFCCQKLSYRFLLTTSYITTYM